MWMYLYCVSDRRENPFVTKEQKIGMIARAEGNAQNQVKIEK